MDNQENQEIEEKSVEEKILEESKKKAEEVAKDATKKAAQSAARAVISAIVSAITSIISAIGLPVIAAVGALIILANVLFPVEAEVANISGKSNEKIKRKPYISHKFNCY